MTAVIEKQLFLLPCPQSCLFFSWLEGQENSQTFPVSLTLTASVLPFPYLLSSTCHSEVTGQGKLQASAQGKPIHGSNGGRREGCCGDENRFSHRGPAGPGQRPKAGGIEGLTGPALGTSPVHQSGYLEKLAFLSGNVSGGRWEIGTGTRLDGCCAGPLSCWCLWDLSF